MGGEGSISQMISTLKYNRSLTKRFRDKKRESFNRLKEPSKGKSLEVNYKTFTPAELEHFKLNLKKERKRGNRVLVISLILLCSIGAFLIYLFGRLFTVS